jgi:hypothetical protein
VDDASSGPPGEGAWRYKRIPEIGTVQNSRDETHLLSLTNFF